MGSETPLTLSYTPSTSGMYGVKIGENRYLHAPQGMNTEDFKSYLAQYEPDTFRALNVIAEKYPPRELTEEEREKINNTRLGSCKMIAKVKPSQVKSFWQKIKNWFTKQSEKPHNITLEDLADAMDKGIQVKDAIDKIHNNTTTLPVNTAPYNT